MNETGVCHANAVVQLLMNIESFVSIAASAPDDCHPGALVLRDIVQSYRSSPHGVIDLIAKYLRLQMFMETDTAYLIWTNGFEFLFIVAIAGLVDAHLRPGWTRSVLNTEPVRMPAECTYAEFMRRVRLYVGSEYHVLRVHDCETLQMVATAEEWNTGCVVDASRMQIVAFNAKTELGHICTVSFINGRWTMQDDAALFEVDASSLCVLFTATSSIVVRTDPPPQPVFHSSAVHLMRDQVREELRLSGSLQVCTTTQERDVFALPLPGTHSRIRRTAEDCAGGPERSAYTRIQMGPLPSTESLPPNVTVRVGPHLCHIIHSFQELTVLHALHGSYYMCSPLELPCKPGDAFAFAGRRGCWFARMMTLAALRSAYAHRGANVLRPLHVGPPDGADAWEAFDLDDKLQVCAVEREFLSRGAAPRAAFERITVVVFGYILPDFVETHVRRLARQAAIVQILCVPCIESQYHSMHRHVQHIFMALALTFASGLHSRNAVVHDNCSFLSRGDLDEWKKRRISYTKYEHDISYTVDSGAVDFEYDYPFLAQHAFLHADLPVPFVRFEGSRVETRPCSFVVPHVLPRHSPCIIDWRHILLLDACSATFDRRVQLRPALIRVPMDADVMCECDVDAIRTSFERHLRRRTPTTRPLARPPTVSVRVVQDFMHLLAAEQSPSEVVVTCPAADLSPADHVAFGRTLALCVERVDASRIDVVCSAMADEFMCYDAVLRRAVRPGARCVFPPRTHITDIHDAVVTLSNGVRERLSSNVLDWYVLVDRAAAPKRGAAAADAQGGRDQVLPRCRR